MVAREAMSERRVPKSLPDLKFIKRLSFELVFLCFYVSKCFLCFYMFYAFYGLWLLSNFYGFYGFMTLFWASCFCVILDCNLNLVLDFG